MHNIKLSFTKHIYSLLTDTIQDLLPDGWDELNFYIEPWQTNASLSYPLLGLSYFGGFKQDVFEGVGAQLDVIYKGNETFKCDFVTSKLREYLYLTGHYQDGSRSVTKYDFTENPEVATNDKVFWKEVEFINLEFDDHSDIRRNVITLDVFEVN